MNTDDLKTNIIDFFENIEKYYGSKTEVSIGLTTTSTFDAKQTTWNLSEFNLTRSAYRKEGNKFMIEGVGFYTEIDASAIISFNKLGRNKFEFVEQYSLTIFRITKLKFDYKY